MYQLKPPIAKEFPPYVKYPGFFSQSECEELIDAGKLAGLEYGTIGNGDDGASAVVQDYRMVRTAFLKPLSPDGTDLIWAFEKLSDTILRANADLYRFDLSGLNEGLTLLRYDAEPGEEPGHYKWHQDFGGGPSSNRKLTVCVQLSPAVDYDGCRLRLFNNMDYEPHSFSNQGDMIIMPSWTPHMVTPITRGRRYALAVWVSGPQFR